MNYSFKNFLGDKPYSDYEEYLEDYYLYIVICLRTFIVRSYGMHLQLPDYNEVLLLIDSDLNKKDIDSDQEPQDWYNNMISRRELSNELGRDFQIDIIAYKLGLKEFAVFSLVMAMFVTINRKYQRIFQFIHRDISAKNPTLELCARIFCQQEGVIGLKVYKCINSCIEEFKILFPELETEEHPGLGALSCDERLVELLLGMERVLTKGISIFDEEELDPILYREKELQCLTGFMKDQEYPLFFLYGEGGAGKKHLIKHFSRINHSALVIFDIRSFSFSEYVEYASLMDALRFAIRECIIKTLPLAIVGMECLREIDLKHVILYLQENVRYMVQLIFLVADLEQCNIRNEGLYTIEFGSYTELQRIQLWNYYTRNYELESAINIPEIGNTFVITPGQMIGAIRQAALQSGANLPIQEKLLYQACYGQLNHKLEEKSNRVKTSFQWDDLKMPEQDKEMLRDVCNCIKNKHIVMNEWNFSKVIPYGAGLTVLFSGPPGTGKTMAAQVIANELKMELYKIDLSQIFDKYVGETEKNIRMIFDQAQKSNSILFFDEADSIFNKRLEASNSNDRFANIESSLLLQYVEAYSGISILATNHVNSIDTAFIRRFKYYILFREPDELVRYEIWKSVIPKEAPLSGDVDLMLFAKQFPFNGAVIKNIVLSAAYLAAEKGEDISVLDLLRSIKREMFKNNLILTKEKLGGLGYLFEDI